MQPLGEFPATHFGHHNIADHQINSFSPGNELQRFRATASGKHGIAKRTEIFCIYVAQLNLIFHQQDVALAFYYLVTGRFDSFKFTAETGGQKNRDLRAFKFA